MDLAQHVGLETKQILSQAQIQSLEILAMDAVELEEYLQNEYMSNPLLERRDNHEMYSSMENFSNWYEKQHPKMNFAAEREEDSEARRDLAAPDTDYLKNYLTSQLDMNRYTKQQWQTILYLIDCLGDDGFFKMPVKEVAALTGCAEEQIQELLLDLSDLEPFGIFAPDLAHCLLKQLEAEGIENPVLEEMVLRFLPEISEGKISVISRQLGLTTAEVRKYIAIIERLNPRPLSGLQESFVSYIVPDILYVFKDGSWEIQINDKWFGEYHINDYYLRMMHETKDQELFDYFRQKLERSRFIVKSIEQRRETMNLIASKILEKQKDYFEGKKSLRSMTMCALAKELNIHPSTVSRAIKGKYIQSPAGTILMKKLFTGTVSSCKEGEDYTAENIKTRIRELVEKEDKKKPLSDAKLAELLVSEGMHISRRAVAKYRDELWIKSSFDRRIR
ncbi:MAG: RNA polymerase factor sigma-54 [Lachnospiraceae bacterium]|nr:RNA polymerase factor sigma-54 [Lachnospiraceae bacterium]